MGRSMENLSKRIETIPGEDGWWKSSSKDRYESLAKDLITKGFSEDEVIGILEEAYWAAANCYGA